MGCVKKPPFNSGWGDWRDGANTYINNYEEKEFLDKAYIGRRA